MKTISVKVQPDHLERLAYVRKPMFAIEELIWNGLDADANEVRIELERNPLGGIEAVTVSDNGHGIHIDDATDCFEKLGGSWKRLTLQSKKNGRAVHGKAGRGRFRAFSLGEYVEWATRYENNSECYEYKIHGERNYLGIFKVGDPQLTNRKTGTDVRISNMRKSFSSLSSSKTVKEITEDFALYIRAYPDVSIYYDGVKIDPSEVEDRVIDYELDPITLSDGSKVIPVLTIIEWKSYVDRALLLCDSAGFTLHKVYPRIQAAGYNFTAYLKTDEFQKWANEGTLELDDLHPDIALLIDIAKGKLREHFRQRSAEAGSELVETWKEQNVYPYSGEPANFLEAAERQVFDVCALSVNEYLPDFETADVRTKRLQLQLLKQALKNNGKAVFKIFEDVLGLPKDKQEELAELLEKTSLSAIISAAKVVTDRLDFLRALEILVFDAESKKALLERKQLHRILVGHTWLFGEEFHLTNDDESLTEVLRKHLSILGREELALDEPVLREDGSRGIVDLMLSRKVPQPRAEDLEHLVVELKAPKVKIDLNVVNQIQSYAFAVMEDERFSNVNTKWTFWAISNEINDSAQRMGQQNNRPEGLVWEGQEGQVKIWVKTWSQVIHNCRARLRFFEENLKYTADTASALDYLHRTHEKYLPECILLRHSAEANE